MKISHVNNVEDPVNNNTDLQFLFSEIDPDKISEKLLCDLFPVIKDTSKIDCVQLTSNSTPYWNYNLEESRREVKAKQR